MPHCLDNYDTCDMEVENFDGQNWESHIVSTDIHKWTNETPRQPTQT